MQLDPGGIWTDAEGAPQASRLIIEFFYEAVKNEEKSNEAGRPIFEDQEFIEIKVPGDRNEIRRRPVRPGDREKYALAYAAFKNKQSQAVQGTPLDALGFTKALVKEFEGVDVRTVEQLAVLSDGIGQKFMGFHDFKRKAVEYLKMAKEKAPLTALLAELEKRDQQIAAMQKGLADQAQKIEELNPNRRK